MIVVFGSINLDLVFSVPHLPSPGETVVGPSYKIFHGGKGANQAVAAARAGAPTKMIGAVGRDHFGPDAMEALRVENIEVQHVQILDTPTGCAAIGIDPKAENQIMVASGANALVHASFFDELPISKETVLLTQMEVSPAASWSAIERVKKAGGRTILNAAPANQVPRDIMGLLDYLIVNQLESVVVARSAGVEQDDPVLCARELARHYGTAVVITLGPNGSVLCRQGEAITVTAPVIEPVDTTGAGDTFCGVLAASLNSGLSDLEAMKRASLAGALACLKKGARSGMPLAEEISAGLLNYPIEVHTRIE